MSMNCCRRNDLASRRARSLIRRLIIGLALSAASAGCAAPGQPARSSRSAQHAVRAAAHGFHFWRLGAGRGDPHAFVASEHGAGGRVSRGLAVFSSADGHVIRRLSRDRRFPVAAAASPDGRWVYFFRASDLAPGRCQGNGFTEPALWRMRVSGGGRPQRTGLRTTSLAFSPDGRMLAYTSVRRCGRTIWIVVRDRKAGTTHRILLARNAPTSNNAVVTAQLAWAPDDEHLAVAVAPAAGINALFVVNARTAAKLPARAIKPCNGQEDECLDPSFDHMGRLTFLKWRNQLGDHEERVVRWQHGRAIRLITLSSNQSARRTASIAADAGDAVLIEGGIRRNQIWRWSRGRITLILSSARRRPVSDALWL